MAAGKALRRLRSSARASAGNRELLLPVLSGSSILGHSKVSPTADRVKSDLTHESHALRYADAQQIEPHREGALRGGAEQEAGIALLFGVCAEHRARLIKRGEARGELVKVSTEAMRLQRGCRRVDGAGEVDEGQREGAFARMI